MITSSEYFVFKELLEIIIKVNSNFILYSFFLVVFLQYSLLNYLTSRYIAEYLIFSILGYHEISHKFPINSLSFVETHLDIVERNLI